MFLLRTGILDMEVAEVLPRGVETGERLSLLLMLKSLVLVSKENGERFTGH